MSKLFLKRVMFYGIITGFILMGYYLVFLGSPVQGTWRGRIPILTDMFHPAREGYSWVILGFIFLAIGLIKDILLTIKSNND